MDHLRVGDAERETAITALGEHYAVGRLTKEEFDERSDAAWSARVRRDLDVLFFDLPGKAPVVPSQRSRRHHRRPLRAVVVPVILAVIVLTIVTHFPIWLFFLVALFCVSRLARRGW